MDINLFKRKYKGLIDKALDIMADSNDPVHGIAHIEGVVENTILLLEKYPEVDKEATLLCAYWHAVARKEGKEDYRIKSAELLKKELIALGFESTFVTKCYQMISRINSLENNKTLEEKILQDAENIDGIGIKRWKACIEANVRTPRIIPSLRDSLLLSYAKELYDKNVVVLLDYLKKEISGK